ncbi:hypothetical protein [Proteiniphilum sp. X52]|uniref:hypothetical protein n=1 Tax=Proteiniphilum sp. X52 TaxID=2382159 RepID=UPI000F0A9164|nr:hypothetical protein [Proteiniphilum sp. X52]RNC63286.1 hypothetical protein D7D25_17335 [Proteiniphilum sp. X52]
MRKLKKIPLTDVEKNFPVLSEEEKSIIWGGGGDGVYGNNGGNNGNDYYWSQTEHGWFTTTTTSYYSGQYANDYYDSNSASSHYTNQIIAAMAVGAGCVNAYLGAGISVFGILNAQQAYAVCNAINKAARTGGVKVVRSSSPNGYGGASVTAIYDSQDNLIYSY